MQDDRLRYAKTKGTCVFHCVKGMIKSVGQCSLRDVTHHNGDAVPIWWRSSIFNYKLLIYGWQVKYKMHVLFDVIYVKLSTCFV